MQKMPKKQIPVPGILLLHSGVIALLKMRVVGIVFGISFAFALAAQVVLLYHLRHCNGIVRVSSALFGSFFVFCLVLLRFAFHVVELKLLSWVDVKVSNFKKNHQISS
jgi:hypothetical protein